MNIPDHLLLLITRIIQFQVYKDLWKIDILTRVQIFKKDNQCLILYQEIRFSN